MQCNNNTTLAFSTETRSHKNRCLETNSMMLEQTVKMKLGNCNYIHVEHVYKFNVYRDKIPFSL
jgi:hypothetical protein